MQLISKNLLNAVLLTVFSIMTLEKVSASTITFNYITTSFPTEITPEIMDNLLGIIDANIIPPLVPVDQLRIRKILRAAFHDCMGGCDGSLNLTAT